MPIWGPDPELIDIVVVGGRIDQEYTAGSLDRRIPVAAHLARQQVFVPGLPVKIGRLADPRLPANIRPWPPVSTLL